VWPKHVDPLNKPLLTPYYRKESCDLTVINKAYIVALHNGMDIIKLRILHVDVTILLTVWADTFQMSIQMHNMQVNFSKTVILVIIMQDSMLNCTASISEASWSKA
jgi:hypothetical protein